MDRAHIHQMEKVITYMDDQGHSSRLGNKLATMGTPKQHTTSQIASVESKKNSRS